jgi:hypothetical protein
VLIVALGALVAKLMETTDVTDEAAEAMKDYEKNLQKTSDTIDYQIGELERKAELEELNARKAGKSEAYINKLKRKSLADQIAYLESKKDAEDKAWFNEWEKIQLSSKSEEEKTKLQQELTEKTAQYTKKITQQIDALKHQSRVNEINEDIKLSEEQKSIQLKKLEDFQKAEEERQKGFKQYRAELLSEEKKFQQLSIDQMADGKDKELAQLKFNFEQEIAEVKYSQELKKALTDKYNKDVAAVNSKYYYQELEQIGANLTAYVKAQKTKRDRRLEEEKKTNAEILAEQEKFNQKVNEQFKNALNQFTQTVVSEVSNSIKRAFEGVSESSQISLKILEMQQKELEKTMKDVERSDLERLQARQQYLKNEQDIMDATQSNMSKLFKSILLGVADFLIQLGTGLVVAATATDAFFQSLKSNPKLAIAAGLAAITAGVATKAIIERGPKFANGGIVSGPTLGLVGEYPGASTNPEVIAPLDKLQSMINGTGGGEGGYIAETRVSGRDLAIVLNRYNKDAQRG